MDKNTKLIKEVLNAIAIVMAIASIVLGYFGIELANTVPLLGIGLFAIGINQLIKK
ncbi:hypothetical protein J4411_01170 [Candidatus Pacearchaeota archaeon]|nr:hypothetical protein [uncultured archaeon]MBS3084505.1 hypothetical protein [Candidatus Pacearchaeota archaeon]